MALFYGVGGMESVLRAGEGSDKVPRHRLLTNAEFLALLDSSSSISQQVNALFSSLDTNRALQTLMQYFKTRTTPVYFFNPAEVEEKNKAFQQRYPEAAEDQRRQADLFIRTYGYDVDWKMPGKNIAGKPHTPNTVRLLARQWQAENIALSFYYTHDKLYLNFLRDHVNDFVSDYEAGTTETGGNDIFERFYAGHRVRNWMMAYQLQLGTDDYGWQDRLQMVKVFFLHGAKLYDQSKKFNWGNHQLVGLVGLYELSTMFPEFPVMRFWNQHALTLILEHLEKEIERDGFQFERASHYFKLDIMNYFRVYRLAQLNDVALPKMFEDRFHTMFDAIVALAMPNKNLPVLQDAQDSYTSAEKTTAARSGFGTAQSSDAAELAEPTEETFLSLGASLFRDPVYKWFGAKELPSVFYWYLDPAARQAYAELPSQGPTIGSIALPESKYYVMRTGWNPHSLYMIIDGGLAHDKPDHTHGGILGIQLFGLGVQLLPNYRVRYSDPSYPVMKNSLVKNVALVDTIVQGRKWKPNAARTGFGLWQSLPTPVRQEWYGGQRYDYFAASHDGFEQVGVNYRRSVLFLKPSYWLVFDDFAGTTKHSYQQLWQGEYTIDKRQRRAIVSDNNGSLVVAQPRNEKVNISQHTVAGKHSIWFERTSRRGDLFSTLLYPREQADSSKLEFTSFSFRHVAGSSIKKKDAVDLVFRGDGKLWSASGVKSNARIAVERRDSTLSLTSMLLYRGDVWENAELSISCDSSSVLEICRLTKEKWTLYLNQQVERVITIGKTGRKVQKVPMHGGERKEIILK
jgi:hypothetical protein